MNWDRIEQLLNIADKSRQWPNLRRIHDAAIKTLEEAASVPEPVIPQEPRSIKRKVAEPEETE